MGQPPAETSKAPSKDVWLSRCLVYFLFLTIPYLHPLFAACLVSYATETVMQKCHGRRRCTLSADSATFGKPCHPDSRMYLKVVYTCGEFPPRPPAQKKKKDAAHLKEPMICILLLVLILPRLCVGNQCDTPRRRLPRNGDDDYEERVIRMNTKLL